MKKTSIIFSMFCLAIILSACGDEVKERPMTTTAIDFSPVNTLMESSSAKQIKVFGEVIDQSDLKAIYESFSEEEQVTFQTVSDTSTMKFAEMKIDGATVHEQTDRNSTIIGTFEKGKTIMYLKERINSNDGSVWYKVSLDDGSIGYIDDQSASLTETEAVVSSQSAQNNNASNQGQTSKKTTTTLLSGDYIEITSDTANVRIDPNIDAKVLYTANKGEYFIFTGTAVNTTDGRTWYEVMFGYNFTEGYISSLVGRIVTDKTQTTSTKSQYFYVTTPGANVRASADINSGVVFVADNGDALTYLGYYEKTADGRTWYLVSNGAQSGYISGNTGSIK